MLQAMNATATRRAVRDLLAHGLRGDLATSVVGVELGSQLQNAITQDIADQTTPAAIINALREESLHDAHTYARLLELIVLAGLDELQVIAALPDTDIQPRKDELPAAPPRRPARRRRRA
jgi:hypothetical protein